MTRQEKIAAVDKIANWQGELVVNITGGGVVLDEANWAQALRDIAEAVEAGLDMHEQMDGSFSVETSVGTATLDFEQREEQ